MAVNSAQTPVVGDQPHTRGEGIAVANRNHYNYVEFIQYLNKFPYILTKILSNPDLIPYVPVFVHKKNAGGRYAYSVESNEPDHYNKSLKEIAFARAKWLYYLFGIQTSYFYDNKRSRIELRLDQSQPAFNHPITKRWFTGEVNRQFEHDPKMYLKNFS